MPLIVNGEVIDDAVISTHYSDHTMNRTLRLALRLLRGIPQAEVCVRRNGDMAAWLHTNFRGELDEVEVYGPIRPKGSVFGVTTWSGSVTPMNPRGPIFQSA